MLWIYILFTINGMHYNINVSRETLLNFCLKYAKKSNILEPFFQKLRVNKSF